MYNDTKGKFVNPNSIIKMPKLHLTTVRDTIVKCTQCLGSGFILIKHESKFPYWPYNKPNYEQKRCFACNGTRETYISREGISHR